MADDTRNAQGETPLEAAIADFWAMEAQRGVTQADLDKVIAAVRAEQQQELDAMTARLRAECQHSAAIARETEAAVRAESRMTVVKLRDDEQSPVAAPCAIAGACQYSEAYENARIRLLNLTTKALADSRDSEGNPLPKPFSIGEWSRRKMEVLQQAIEAHKNGATHDCGEWVDMSGYCEVCNRKVG